MDETQLKNEVDDDATEFVGAEDNQGLTGASLDESSSNFTSSDEIPDGSPNGNGEGTPPLSSNAITGIVACVIAGVIIAIIASTAFGGGSSDNLIFMNEDKELHFRSNLKEDTKSVEIYEQKAVDRVTNLVADNNTLYTLLVSEGDSRNTATLSAYDLTSKEIKEVEIDVYKTSNNDYSSSYLINTYGNDVLYVAFDELKYYDAKAKSVIEIEDNAGNVYLNDNKKGYFTTYKDGEYTLFSLSSDFKVTEIDDEILNIYASSNEGEMYFRKYGEMFKYSVGDASSTLLYEIAYDNKNSEVVNANNEIRTSAYNHQVTVYDQDFYIVDYYLDVSIASLVNIDTISNTNSEAPTEPSRDAFTSVEKIQEELFGEIYEYENEVFDSVGYKDAYAEYEEEKRNYDMQEVFKGLKDALNDNGYKITEKYRDLYVNGELVAEKLSSTRRMYSSNYTGNSIMTTASPTYNGYDLSDILENISLSSYTNVNTVARSVSSFVSNGVNNNKDSQYGDLDTNIVSAKIALTSVEDILDDDDDLSITAIEYIENEAYITTFNNAENEIYLTKYTIGSDKNLSSPKVIFTEEDVYELSVFKNEYNSDIYLTYVDSGDSILNKIVKDEVTQLAKDVSAVRIYKNGTIMVETKSQYDLGYYLFTLNVLKNGELERISKEVYSYELLSDGSYLILEPLSKNNNGDTLGGDLVKIDSKGNETEIEDEVIWFIMPDSNTEYFYK